MSILAQQRLPEALDRALQGYADGTLPCALHALIGAHLELNPANRAYVAALEGEMAESAMDVPGIEASRAGESRAGRLDAILRCPPLSPAQCERPTPPGWPRALRHYVGETPEKLPFRTLLPGIAECRLAGDGNAEALLYRVRGGRRIPEHAHEGEEFTLVLSGALEDGGRCYAPGDINVGDAALPHAPMAAPGQDCLCFVVLTGPLRLTGPFGRLFNRFLRH